MKVLQASQPLQKERANNTASIEFTLKSLISVLSHSDCHLSSHYLGGLVLYTSAK